jgi:glycosyltransferase involved in cell wall biosynthesis
MSPTTRLRVTLVNHAYVAAENQKNLSALAREVDLQTIVPAWYPNEQGGVHHGAGLDEQARTIVWKQPLMVRGQCLLYPFGIELAKHRPHLVHVEYAPWSPLTLETAMLVRRHAPQAKLVVTIKKNTYLPRQGPKELAKAMLRRTMAGRIAAYVATSEMARQLCLRFFGYEQREVHVCEQLGIDLERFSPAVHERDGGEVVIGYVGRLEAYKGVVELVQAVRQFSEQAGAQVRLRLLGNGSLRPRLEQLARELPWLSLEGPVPHGAVARFLRECDVFALLAENEPDHQEHDAHALIEAMATGLPAIVTRSGVIAELVDESAALFVREGSVGDVCAAIARLTADRALRRSLGARARAIALARFGLAHVAKRRETIYRTVSQC